MTVHNNMFDEPTNTDEQDNSNVFAVSYKNRENSYIVVSRIAEPYGPGSDPVVSVGCTLKGDIRNPTWKVHIPEDLLDDVIQSIQLARLDKAGL